MDYYLDEFTFRFNRRTSRSGGKHFYRIVKQAVAVDPFDGQKYRVNLPKNIEHRILYILESSAYPSVTLQG